MLRSCEVLRQAPLSLLLTVIVFLTTDLCVSKCLEHCKHRVELPNSMFATFNYSICVLNATSSTDWPKQLAWLSYIPVKVNGHKKEADTWSLREVHIRAVELPGGGCVHSIQNLHDSVKEANGVMGKHRNRQPVQRRAMCRNSEETAFSFF